MDQASSVGGAAVRVQARAPAVDLASLVELLCAVVDPQPGSGFWGLPAFSLDRQRQRLQLNTYGVLRRLLASDEFRKRFREAAGSGFLQDLKPVPRGQSARMGGRLSGKDLGGLTAAVAALQERLQGSLAVTGVRPERLCVSAPVDALRTLARHVGGTDPTEAMRAEMVALEFAAAGRTAADRKQDVARAVTAIERIQAQDWIERLARAMAERQRKVDDVCDPIQGAMLQDTLLQEARKPDSQIARFQCFLAEGALSRVRMQVSFAIMEALIAQAKPGKPDEVAFADYVRRVSVLHDGYGSAEATRSLFIDASAAYGLGALCDVGEFLGQARFYHCLPLWAEWNAQFFELHQVHPRTHGLGVEREVSYRFRINGRNPRMPDTEHAFAGRLVRLSRVLLAEGDEEPPAHQVKRSLAQVVLLWLAFNPGLSAQSMEAQVELLRARIVQAGRDAVREMLADLQSWSGRVQRLSRTLIALLRRRPQVVMAQAQRSVRDYYVVIQDSIIDWAFIEGNLAREWGGVQEPLVQPMKGGPEEAAWLQHIKIARAPEEVPANLFSIRVQTVLHERTLSRVDRSPRQEQVAREIPSALLNACWSPIRLTNQQADWAPLSSLGPEWGMGAGIDVLYDPLLLQRRAQRSGRRQVPEEDQQQFRAAATCALAVLALVALRVVVRFAAEGASEPPLLLMLRLQTEGRGADSRSGEPPVYAAAQAVEGALMAETPARMQGLVLGGTASAEARDAGRRDMAFKVRGAVYALGSAFPLVQRAQGGGSALQRVGLVVYDTRPCDTHPKVPEADGQLFVARTYVAERCAPAGTGYRLAFVRAQTHVVVDRDSFRSPPLIMEEVARLHREGVTDVILLSHHFGTRRVNQAAQRHSPHTQTPFLDQVAQRFPDVNLYMMRRSILPATRLQRRDRGESAFEVLQLAEHRAFAEAIPDHARQELVPVYTFATLAVVGDDVSRPQSGFCTYFLDTNYQVQDLEVRERVRSHVLRPGPIRDDLLSVLRGLHFLEAEKAPVGGAFQPVLDPCGWLTPPSRAAAGEIVARSSRRQGEVVLSLPALLSHVASSLRRGGRA